MKENLKLGMILFIFTAVAGLLLGFAYEITKEPIARQELIASSAVDEVLPGAKDVKPFDADMPEGSIVEKINAAYDGDKLVGHTLKINTKGFHGAVGFVLGIYDDGKLGGIKILSHSETPGLGANIEKESFRKQFEGKSIEEALVVSKTGASKENEIDAISGATISSNAITNAVNEAVTIYKNLVKGEAPAPEKTKESLVKEILPNYDKLEKIDHQLPAENAVDDVDKIFEGSSLIGYAFKVSYGGFNSDGRVELIVVISPDDKIQGVRVLGQQETPGLGAEIEKKEFTDQFTGKSALESIAIVTNSSKENEVDGISGASMTMSAVEKGINDAIEFYKNELKGKGGN